ncbi:MAG: EI24 domain-containing protein [Coleofasciculus sp. A1-SPW-01]|nr:EI24 domain-containing protein [Coleofasciculus chthonoplastes]
MLRLLSGFGFVTGATYPLRVLAVFRRTPRLWGYMITPILVNVFIGIALYAGLLLLGWQQVDRITLSLSQWLNNAIASLPPWLSFLGVLATGINWVLDVVLVIGLLLITGFLLVQFGVLLGAPWYGQLSEQLEEIRTGQIHTVEVGFIQDIWRAILFELKKLVLGIGVGIFLLMLNILPGIGTLAAAIGGIILTATVTCLDFIDAPLERRRLRFRYKLGIVFKSLPASAGFSLVCMVLITVPLVNLFTIPLCVASGTLFFCDRVLPKLPQSLRFEH